MYLWVFGCNFGADLPFETTNLLDTTLFSAVVVETTNSLDMTLFSAIVADMVLVKTILRHVCVPTTAVPVWGGHRCRCCYFVAFGQLVKVGDWVELTLYM